jgi:Ca2+/Na+ antiporter
LCTLGGELGDEASRDSSERAAGDDEDEVELEPPDVDGKATAAIDGVVVVVVVVVVGVRNDFNDFNRSIIKLARKLLLDDGFLTALAISFSLFGYLEQLSCWSGYILLFYNIHLLFLLLSNNAKKSTHKK